MKYEILEQIGEGSHSIVYKARNVAMKKVVAMKKLREVHLSNPLSIKRFQQEAKITSMLHSPHIVCTFDFGVETDGTLFLVCECLPGVSLRELIQTAGAVSPNIAVKALLQICQALGELQAKGIVHRSLNAQKIMVNEKDPNLPTKLAWIST